MKIIKIIFFNLITLFGLLIVGELIVKLTIDYESDYYAMPKFSKGSNKHPYGNIPINSNGFYDNEWENPKNKPRYGYFGDSVIYGVGAGYPYRITEYLDYLRNKIEHVNISSGIGTNFNVLGTNEEISKFISDNKIDKLIYIMNLNDIAPLAYSVNIESEKIKKFSNTENHFKKESKLTTIRTRLKPIDNILRGKSDLYTFIRFKLKQFIITKFKVNISGFNAIELEPVKFSNDINKAAKNLSNRSISLKKEGVDLCIILLPYEMQISKNAAKKYREFGIKYEDEFLNFLTQKLFVNEFKKYSNIEIEFIKNSFEEKKVGSYFVFNLGDKIDFNHPNRLGHKIIAEQISDREICMK